jgi:hypothetical protein
LRITIELGVRHLDVLWRFPTHGRPGHEGLELP